MYGSNALGCLHFARRRRRGSAWRDNREFVGQIKYGACYRLWNPSENPSFGGNFRAAARVLFLCQRRLESPLSHLPDDCIYYILNMMRWDWVDDTSHGMRREQKHRRRVERQREIAAAEAHIMAGNDAEMGDAELGGVAAAAAEEEGRDADAVLGVDDEDEADGMDEDSSDDSEDADSSDDDSDDMSADSEEYAWGDHVSSRNQFVYDDNESSDSDEDNNSDEEGENEYGRRRRSAMVRARRSILQFLRHH